MIVFLAYPQSALLSWAGFESDMEQDSSLPKAKKKNDLFWLGKERKCEIYIQLPAQLGPGPTTQDVPSKESS